MEQQNLFTASRIYGNELGLQLYSSARDRYAIICVGRSIALHPQSKASIRFGPFFVLFAVRVISRSFKHAFTATKALRGSQSNIDNYSKESTAYVRNRDGAGGRRIRIYVRTHVTVYITRAITSSGPRCP